jgi:hypothetical protein
MLKAVGAILASCVLGLLMLSGCANFRRPPSITPARAVIGQDLAAISKETERATIRALHKQLQERDRTILLRDQQIDMLASQLDALKRIDQEERRRAVRPPAILVP